MGVHGPLHARAAPGTPRRHPHRGRGARGVDRVLRQAGAAPLPRVDGHPGVRVVPAPRRRVRRGAGRGMAGADTGDELYRRLRALPGFGDEKAKIFLAVLAKRCGVAPPGWAERALPFSDSTPRSVADIDGPKRSSEFERGKSNRRRKAKASKIERPNGMRTARYEVARPTPPAEVPIYARSDLCPPLPHSVAKRHVPHDQRHRGERRCRSGRVPQGVMAA